MSSLKNQIAVITGGSSGMGLETAKLFASQGAKVVITGRSPAKLNEAEKEVSQHGEILALKCDVSKMDELDNLYQQTQDKYGLIDILFANAGIGKFAPASEVSEEDFDLLVNVNFKGLFFTVQKALKIFQDNGSIILNASWLGHRGLETTSVSAATKAAVSSLARTFSQELTNRGIRVNSISPGLIRTPIIESSGMDSKEIEQRRQTIPVKRWGEIAKTVLFLASEDSSYILGQDIAIDGGILPLWH